jgi:archaemetzincin
MKLQSLFLIFIGLLSSCNRLNYESNEPDLINSDNKSQKKLSIIIQPFDGISESTVTIVAKKIKEIYSGDVIINKSIPLPKKALNQVRTRYRADTLIRYLGGFVKDGQLIIGLTNKDISTKKGKDPDYGIMGLGFCPGKSCIASTFRLNGKNKNEKLFKVAIHELGHTQGLAKTNTKHCPEKVCLMRDAEGKDHLNELKYFCSKCRPILINAGWELK